MSKPICTPHIVTIYGLIGEGDNKVLRVTEVVHKPSKSCAEKYASERRKDSNVTSAQVTALSRVNGGAV